MKKALKVTMGLALATSALTPVAAFASLADDHKDSVALDGFYNTVTGEFYNSADFKALDKAAKTEILKNADFIFVLNGKVYPGNAAVTSTNAELKDAATSQVDYEEENGILFTDDGRIIGEDGEVIDTVVKVTEVEATTDEATRTTTVTANVDNYEEGATATVTITPDATLELEAIVTEDVAIDEDGKVTLNVGELPNGTHTATVTVGETSTTAEFVVELAALPTVAKIEEVKAVSANKLEVTFNKAIEDTTKAVIAVNKGSVKVNTSSVKWNEAKTVATIEVTGKLSAGEYIVTVTGLEEEALTGKVTAENEKVEAVTIASEIAPLTNVTAGSKTVAVGYKVVNQYGEDVTNTTSLLATASGAVVKNTPTTLNKGIATISVEDTVKENDVIILTLIHTETGKSVSQTVKVGAQSKVAEVAITSLYNKDNKVLTETTDLSKDAFYLVVEGKDQYGNVLKSGEMNGLIGNNTNTSVAQVNGGAAPTVETITVAGKDISAIKVTGPLKAGATNILLISPTTGKNASFTITVAEAQRADTIAFEVPTLVVAKEDLFIPVQVTDKSGAAVKDEKLVKDATRGVALSGVTGATFATKDGVLGVTIPSTSLSTGYLTLVGVTSTNKSSIATFQVKEEAKATIVTGLTKGTSTTLLVNDTLKLSTANLTVEDQYGRVMTKATLDTWLAGVGNAIIVQDTPATNTLTVTNTDGAAQTNLETVTLSAIGHTATVTGAIKGTEKVSIKLANTANPTGLATSAKDVNFQVTDGTEYASYEVDAVGTVYDEVGASKANSAAYDKAVKVYGVLSNGSKVLLKNSTDYSLSSTNADLNTDVSDGVINVNSAYTYATNATEVKIPLTVTINATGEKLNQEVTISKVAPKATKVDIVKEGTMGTTMTATTAVDYPQTAVFDYSKLAGAVDVVVTDQYGVKVELTDSNKAFADGTSIVSTLTFTKVEGNLVFVSNGSTNASVTEIPVNSIFNVVVTAGDVTSSPLKVTATTGFSTVTTNNKVLTAVRNALTPTNGTVAASNNGKTLTATIVNPNANVETEFAIATVANAIVAQGITLTAADTVKVGTNSAVSIANLASTPANVTAIQDQIAVLAGKSGQYGQVTLDDLKGKTITVTISGVVYTFTVAV